MPFQAQLSGYINHAQIARAIWNEKDSDASPSETPPTPAHNDFTKYSHNARSLSPCLNLKTSTGSSASCTQ